MRSPKLRGGPICEFERTVTPMVDVVFMLLLFFVLASGGRMAEATLASPLSAGTISSLEPGQPERAPAEIWIRLRRDVPRARTLIQIDGRALADTAALARALQERAAQQPQASVILEAAREVPFGDIIAAYDACRAAKFHSINFAATPEELAEP
jgi:biopolymer transport protein ExbD